MNRKTVLTICVCIMILTVVSLMAGCKSKTHETGPIINSVKISISIDYPKDSEVDDVKDEAFKIEESSTALDAMQLYCSVLEIPVTIDTTSASVQGINGVENSKKTASHKYRWQYKINGKLCDKPQNEVVLKDGDSLEWIYRP